MRLVQKVGIYTLAVSQVYLLHQFNFPYMCIFFMQHHTWVSHVENYKSNISMNTQAILFFSKTNLNKHRSTETVLVHLFSFFFVIISVLPWFHYKFSLYQSRKA